MNEINKEMLNKKSELTKAISSIVSSQAEVIIAEAQGSKMQRNWRPTLMYLLMFVIVWFGVIAGLVGAIVEVDLIAESIRGLQNIPEDMWSVIKIGMGGYIGSRGVEKVAKSISEGFGTNGHKNND